MRRALLLDTETTGLDPAQGAACIEVACIVYDLVDAAPVASFASLLRHDGNDAEAINRIPPTLLVDAPEPDRVWRYVESLFARVDVVIAQRAEFDRKFVPAKVRDLKPWVCSKTHLELPRSKLGDGLVSIALAHGVGVVEAHRAMADVETMARLLTRLRELGHDLVALIERAMRPRVKVAALVSFDDRELAKGLGFLWEPSSKQWLREVPVDEIGSLPFKVQEV